ncbi:ATP-binding protein [Hyphomonas sp. GM-8P]|uniref:ATP-binding protein n=1 Tax=Hyphomonas sp. GM-8P TaxID=1280945 RepID=UPI000DC007A2|nr:ATP-binding protein [Hyphomonas sp. GM-8P]RAN38913.1 hypothetical protein HY26_17210 [Hyphomonas sp. GM-8P]
MAATLIESLRDIGYTLETALADIVDNSITAGARSIDIHSRIADDGLTIGILDDGCGMSRSELESAMRPGSKHPLDYRPASDLGRFGLGLKTASFSQCRKLTVLTQKNGVRSAAVWDLDHVANTNRWEVIVPDNVEDIPWSDMLESQGTLVVWEQVDRIVDEVISSDTEADVNRKLDDARSHLELVFHRFLNGEPGLSKISIKFNSAPLDAWDPFARYHPATQAYPIDPEEVEFRGQKITLQSYTLPHHQKCSKAEWEKNAGKGGYTRNQGFYLYREKRLILHGSWFNLARKSELTKLCRVRVDMPNGLDGAWKIDVKKASAQPPRIIRQRLRNLIEGMGDQSRRVYTRRGQRLASSTIVPLWARQVGPEGISYEINIEHPVISTFLDTLSDDEAIKFESMAKLISRSLPYDAIFADLGRDPLEVEPSATDEELRALLEETVEPLLAAGFDNDQITRALEAIEPFRSHWTKTLEFLVPLLAAGDKN